MYPNFVNSDRIAQIKRYQTRQNVDKNIQSHYTKTGEISKLAKPVHAYIETISTCNYACPSCFQGNSEAKAHYLDLLSTNSMSLDSFKKYVRNLVAGGIRSIALYNTNEPFLDSLLEKRLQYLESYNLDDLILMSNGLLLNSSNTDLVLKSNITKMCFSIDAASSKTYTVVRPIANIKERSNPEDILRLEKVTNNIRAFIERANTERPDLLIRVSFVVTKDNVHEIDMFLDYWRRYADIVEFQYNHVADFSIGTIDNTFRRVEVEACHAPTTTILVRPDGTVYPCCTIYAHLPEPDLSGDLSLGNLNVISYQQILASEKRRKLINDLASKTPDSRCNKCLNSHYCHINYMDNDEFSSFAPVI